MGVGRLRRGRASARSAWAAPTSTSSSKRRPAPRGRELRSGPQVLRFGAQRRGARATSAALADSLTGSENLDLGDVAFTLAGRRDEKTRLAAVVHDRADAAAVLHAAESDNVFIGEPAGIAASEADRVVLLFPGQGSSARRDGPRTLRSRVGVRPGLRRMRGGFPRGTRHRPAYGVLRTPGGRIWSAPTGPNRHCSRSSTHSAARRVLRRRAAAFAGHSIGEYAAATLAGVFDLPTAIRVVAARARLMHASAPGAMVAVGVGPERSPGTFADLDLAAVNDPGNCVISGSQRASSTCRTTFASRGSSRGGCGLARISSTRWIRWSRSSPSCCRV